MKDHREVFHMKYMKFDHDVVCTAVLLFQALLRLYVAISVSKLRAVNQYAYQQVYEAPHHQAKLSHELLGGKGLSLILTLLISAALSISSSFAWYLQFYLLIP